MRYCFTMIGVLLFYITHAQQLPLSFYKSKEKISLSEKRLIDSLIINKQNNFPNFSITVPYFNTPVMKMAIPEKKIIDSTDQYKIWYSPFDNMSGIEPLTTQQYRMPNAMQVINPFKKQ